MPDVATVSKEQLLDWYRSMALIRRVEELAAKAYTLRKILGFCHLYIGQEAVAVGACAALQEKDYVVSAYREHGHILARGADPKAVLAELFAKDTGITRGVGGSMHLASTKLNFFGGYGIVGGHVPLAAGAAFASKYRGDDAVALVFFGDGAAQQGAFFESIALSQLWRLPVVFLIENNYYAMGTSLDRQSYLQDMYKRGHGVGIEAWQFGGFDVVEVYQNVRRAVDHARSGQGPVLLEAITYRYRGHSMSDPAKYRADGELEEKKKQDCIDNVADVLQREHGVTAEALAAIIEEVKKEAQDAYDFADQSPPADETRLYDFTYAQTKGS